MDPPGDVNRRGEIENRQPAHFGHSCARAAGLAWNASIGPSIACQSSAQSVLCAYFPPTSRSPAGRASNVLCWIISVSVVVSLASPNPRCCGIASYSTWKASIRNGEGASAKGAIEIIELPFSIFEKEIEPSRPPLLSRIAGTAWNEIERNLNRRSAKPILVHGVTGSGKTELYLRAAAWCLRNELGAIVLVPEIALATQVVRRFEERFPGRVAVIHSELSDSDRYATWSAIARGDRPIVVGPRSALFSPLPALGAIVIDEEQDSAYKQDTAPKYQAIRLAHKIAQTRSSSLILGSATPSVESYYAATRRSFELVSLPERIGFSAGGIGSDERDRYPCHARGRDRRYAPRSESHRRGVDLVSAAIADRGRVGAVGASHCAAQPARHVDDRYLPKLHALSRLPALRNSAGLSPGPAAAVMPPLRLPDAPNSAVPRLRRTARLLRRGNPAHRGRSRQAVSGRARHAGRP